MFKYIYKTSPFSWIHDQYNEYMQNCRFDPVGTCFAPVLVFSDSFCVQLWWLWMFQSSGHNNSEKWTTFHCQTVKTWKVKNFSLSKRPDMLFGRQGMHVPACPVGCCPAETTAGQASTLGPYTPCFRPETLGCCGGTNRAHWQKTVKSTS